MMMMMMKLQSIFHVTGTCG